MDNNNTTKDAVIIGGGLTGLTLAYYLNKAGKKVLLIEQQDRTGGVINSVTEQGFTYETGPSTGVIGTLEIAELFEDLNNKCSLEIADESAKKRYILKNGKWRALPSGLISAIKTPLFSWYDKFRILGEPFRKKGTNPDESVAELVKRRLGKSYLDYAVDPFISGVYAGDPTKLITRYALPKLYLLEQNYGSFVGGSIQKQREPKLAFAHKITRDVFSAKGGLNSLMIALTEEIGYDNIVTSAKETQLKPLKEGYELNFKNAQGEVVVVHTSKVITTVGGYALPDLLPFVAKEDVKALENMTYAPVIQAAVGYKKWNAKPLDAFGALVPAKEKRNVLGILFPSAIFENRAPKGGALLSVFMGGQKKTEMLNKSDDELKVLIMKEVSDTLGVNDTPDLVRIFRYQHAIAQYDITSGERLAAITRIEKAWPGLILAGNIRDGIGMGDRVKQAKQLANLLFLN